MSERAQTSFRDAERYGSGTAISGLPNIRAEAPQSYASAHEESTSVLASKLQLLIVDSDKPVLRACGEVAEGMGFEVFTVDTASAAREHITTSSPDVVLMDLKLPAGGLSLLEEIRARRPRCSVVVMTAFATVNSAVEAIRIGATDHLTKPFAMDELTSVLERAGQRRSFEIETKRIQRQLQSQRGGMLIGVSPEMQKLHRIVQKVAPANHPLLILGESGTGKEAIARAIHADGPHANRPFQVIECGQLSPSVLEGELFGYARNPHTGESRIKLGALTNEEGGTLFLDSISEVPLDLQSKLLRALQDRKVKPAGAEQSLPVTVRILASSSRNLSALVDVGAFRKDLFYKLNIVSLRIPPLRERKQDIPVLAEFFLQNMRLESGMSYQFAPDAMEAMMDYDWPSNVRELENTVERACSKTSGPMIHKGDLGSQFNDKQSSHVQGGSILLVDERAYHDPVSGKPQAERRAPSPIISIAELEREAILHTIRQLKGDKLMAAKLLGIGKTTLYRKLKEYGISD